MLHMKTLVLFQYAIGGIISLDIGFGITSWDIDELFANFFHNEDFDAV